MKIHSTNLKLFFKSFYEQYSWAIVIASLIFYLCASVIQKVISFFYLEILIQPIISFIKFFFLVYFLGILIVNYKTKKVLLYYLGFFLIFFIAANLNFFSDSNSVFYKFLTLGNFFHLIKYLYPFIFLGTFSLIKNNKELINSYIGIVEKVLLFNTFFIFLGFFFSIDFFQSYPHSNRFGYCGVLDRMFIVNFSIIIITRWVFLKKMNWELLLICLGTVLTGTKLAFLFFTILVFYYLYYIRKRNWVVFLSIILLVALIFIKPLIVFFAKLFPFWQPLLNKQGYVSLLLSTRDLNLEKTVKYLEINGSLENLLIGGIEFPKYLVEMDFVDLFLFFGIIGGILYILLLSKILNRPYHFIPLLTTFFAGGFLLGTITMSTYLLWCNESIVEKNNLFLGKANI